MATTYSKDVANKQAAYNAANLSGIKSGKVTALAVDGISGPKTQAALTSSAAKTAAGMTTPTTNTVMQTTSSQKKADVVANNKVTNMINGQSTASAGKQIVSTLVNKDGSKVVTYSDGTTNTMAADNNGLTPDQIAAGYSTIQGNFDPLTGKPKVAATVTDPTKVTDAATTPAGILSKQVADTQAYYKQQLDQSVSLINEARKAVSTSTANLIDSITQNYAGRQVQMEDLNARTLAGTEKGTYVTGTARYASDQAQGLLTATESAGIQRIADLNSERDLLIAQAEQARDAKDMEAVYKLVDLYDQNRDKMTKEVTDLYTASRQQEKDAVDVANADRNYQLNLVKSQMDQAESIAPGLLSGYSSLKTDADRTKFLNEVSTRTGIDTEVLQGQIANATTKATKDAAELAQTRAQTADSNRSNRGGSGGSSAVEYTDSELKKLRAQGIDPSNTRIADAFLYNDVLPGSLIFDPDAVNFDFADREAAMKINEALKEGYSIDEILEYAGYNKSMSDEIRAAVVSTDPDKKKKTETSSADKLIEALKAKK